MNTTENVGTLMWRFTMPSPCHIRSITTVAAHKAESCDIGTSRSSFDDSLPTPPGTAWLAAHVPLPHCLIIDRKVGHVVVYNPQLTQELSSPLTPAAAVVVDQKSGRKTTLAVATLAVCVYVAEAIENMWVGWSSGVITVNSLCAPDTSRRKDDSVWSARSGTGRTPRTRSTSPVSSLSSSKTSNHMLARWSHKVALPAHRSAVTHIVGGFGPWVFSGGQDGVVVQWDVRTYVKVRSIAPESPKPVKTLSLALGCSASRKLANAKGHLILFYAVEKEPLRVAAVMSAPQGAEEGSETSEPGTSPRSLRFPSSGTASSLLLSRRGSEDAAAVLSVGSEDGHLHLLPLTIFSGSQQVEQLSTAQYLHEFESLSMDTAPTLQVRKGWRINQQGLLHIATNQVSGGASYTIAVATAHPSVSIVRVDVAALVDGGYVTSHHILCTYSVAHSVTSIQPLLPLSIGPSPVALGCVTLSNGQAEFVAASVTPNMVLNRSSRLSARSDVRTEASALLNSSTGRQSAHSDPSQKALPSNGSRTGNNNNNNSDSGSSQKDASRKRTNATTSTNSSSYSTTGEEKGDGAVSLSRFEAVLRQVAHAQKVASDAAAALRVQDEEIKESRAERDALRKQTDLLRAMLAQRDGASRASPTTRPRGPWSEMTDDMHDLAEENEKLRDDIATASRKMAEIKSAWNKKEDDYQRVILDLEKQVMEFTTQGREANNLKTQLDRKTGENARLASQLMSLEKQLANTEAALGLLRNSERGRVEHSRREMAFVGNSTAAHGVGIHPRDDVNTPQRFTTTSHRCTSNRCTEEKGRSDTIEKRVPAPASMNTFRRALQRLDSEPVTTPR